MEGQENQTASRKFCPACGSKLSASSSFCGDCGAAIEARISSPQPPATSSNIDRDAERASREAATRATNAQDGARQSAASNLKPTSSSKSSVAKKGTLPLVGKLLIGALVASLVFIALLVYEANVSSAGAQLQIDLRKTTDISQEDAISKCAGNESEPCKGKFIVWTGKVVGDTPQGARSFLVRDSSGRIHVSTDNPIQMALHDGDNIVFHGRVSEINLIGADEIIDGYVRSVLGNTPPPAQAARQQFGIASNCDSSNTAFLGSCADNIVQPLANLPISRQLFKQKFVPSTMGECLSMSVVVNAWVTSGQLRLSDSQKETWLFLYHGLANLRNHYISEGYSAETIDASTHAVQAEIQNGLGPEIETRCLRGTQDIVTSATSYLTAHPSQ